MSLFDDPVKIVRQEHCKLGGVCVSPRFFEVAFAKKMLFFISCTLLPQKIPFFDLSVSTLFLLDWV